MLTTNNIPPSATTSPPPLDVVVQPTTMPLAGQKRKRAASVDLLSTPQPKHPYLTGNFAPIHNTLPLTPCSHTGTIPPELSDGQYVRNGSNPVTNEDLGRDAHWFDGDGMLSGVSFRKDDTGIVPEFVNQFILTDLYLSALSSPRLKVPILPSIATLVHPLYSIFYVTLRIFRTVLLVLLSHLPGSKQKIRKISVANTNVLYHDGRALALCESGPPMRVQLPELETVGWYNGDRAQGEPEKERGAALGDGSGLLQFMREWTTAHPKVDPQTKEMLMFHSSFAPPYVQYSIIPKEKSPSDEAVASQKLLNAPVPGVRKAKMMHDFGVSLTHTVIMDLPLTLDPVNQLKGLPPVTYDASQPSRFGVFPRRSPEQVQWFETDAACIYHTANTWDDVNATGSPTAVNMLACRLTSATLIYATANIAPPAPKSNKRVAQANRRMPFFAKYNEEEDPSLWERAPLLESPSEEKDTFIRVDALESPSSNPAAFDEEQCRLYYYHFDLNNGALTHQWALAAIPFEFPSVRPDLEMQHARYVYGCSTTTTSFSSALGKATKIDALVKVDVNRLIANGKSHPPQSVTGVVDPRPMATILSANDPHDPIQVFRMPPGWFAQEPRFVPAASNASEDDGYLLFYAFDEAQLNAAGDAPADASDSRAKSELWIIDAKTMKDVVARVQLPQRVPYGLHGTWFSAEQIRAQRPVEQLRSTREVLSAKEVGMWMGVRDWCEKVLG